MADDSKVYSQNRRDTAGMYGGIGGAVGGFLGGRAAEGDRNTARQAAESAIQELISIGTPPDLSQALVLKQFEQAGMLTPELEQYISAGPSQTAAITEDPALRERQMSALNLIGQRATGGFNAEDRAKYNEMRAQVAKEQQARQAQLTQQMQMRGMGGSGAELAQAIANNQSGANQASEAGDRIAAEASRNALNAAVQSGQLGGQVRQQDFDTNRARTSAADEFNRFNVQGQQQAQARNVAARNQGQQFNLTNRQNIGNANVGLANQETQRQSQAKRDYFQDNMNAAKTRASGYGMKSDEFNKRGQDTADQYAGIGNVIGAASGFLGFSEGGMVPGKAPHEGNHPENDIIPAKLSPGEIVLPKLITESKNAPLHAANYVAFLKRIKDEGNE